MAKRNQSESIKPETDDELQTQAIRSRSTFKQTIIDAVREGLICSTGGSSTRDSIFGNDADKAFGYRFGIDGLWKAETAAEFLGISERQLDRLVEERLIRKGRMPGSRHRFFCKRSVVEFAQSLEL